MNKIEQLKSNYENVCNEYIKVFKKKQDIDFDGWVGNEIGGIASFCGQYFFNISDIVWDINSNCRKGLILRWQEDCIEDVSKAINYYSYSNGLRCI